MGSCRYKISKSRTLILTLMRDYAMRFGNSIFYYNLLTNSLKLIKVTLSERELHKEDFHQKSLFLRKSQKTCFCHFLSKQAWNKSKFLRMKCFIHLKHPFRCCVFSFLQVFANFFSFMPNKAKISPFYKTSKFLIIFGMKIIMNFLSKYVYIYKLSIYWLKNYVQYKIRQN